jgi:PhnB protein
MDVSSTVAIFVYVEDVDQFMDRAVAGGAKVLVPAANQFWGDRIAWIMDPSGHVWTIATRVEETTEEQRQERLARIIAQAQQQQ